MGKLKKVIDKEFVNIDLDTNTNGNIVWSTCPGKNVQLNITGKYIKLKYYPMIKIKEEFI